MTRVHLATTWIKSADKSFQKKDAGLSGHIDRLVADEMITAALIKQDHDNMVIQQE